MDKFGRKNMSSAIRSQDQLLKKGIWAYFLLLIFEGALRKWVLPGLSTPLLIIRDPLALWIVIALWQRGILPKSRLLTGMFVLGVAGMVTALAFGHGSLPVAIFGARILLIHFPFMYAMGKIFDRDDVIEVGKTLLLISIPMVVLIALQFYSPQSAWVNRGIGGDIEGGGFSGAQGFFRPPGTFSFTNGNSLFFSFVATFVMYFWLNPKAINRFVLIGSSIALMMSIPLSISRTLMFTTVIVILFAAVGASRNPKFAGKMIVAVVILMVGILVVSQLGFVQTSIGVLSERFENANATEGSLQGTLVTRYLGGLLNPVINAAKQPFFGYGIGMGTSVGSQLLTGKVTYLIDEGEWGRLFGEMGLLMGAGVIFIRLALCVRFCVFGYKKLVAGDLLPWMLLSFGLLTIPQGQWSQPTSLGFSTLIGGLLFASLRNMSQQEKEYRMQTAKPGLSKDELTGEHTDLKLS